MINVEGKRAESHRIESGALSATASCPHTLALWVIEHR